MLLILKELMAVVPISMGLLLAPVGGVVTDGDPETLPKLDKWTFLLTTTVPPRRPI